jgi:hypothetical protein
MKKLKLQIESLQVQSFNTTNGDQGERGTVRGQNAPSEDFGCTWICITLSCLCGNTEKLLCSAAGCPVVAQQDEMG